MHKCPKIRRWERTQEGVKGHQWRTHVYPTNQWVSEDMLREPDHMQLKRGA